MAMTSYMALLLLPFQKIRPAFHGLAPSTQDVFVSDNMKSFTQYSRKTMDTWNCLPDALGF